MVLAESHSRTAWDHTAAKLCLQFNASRGPKTKAARIEDFHPHRERKRPAMTVDQLHAMRPMFERQAKAKPKR